MNIFAVEQRKAEVGPFPHMDLPDNFVVVEDSIAVAEEDSIAVEVADSLVAVHTAKVVDSIVLALTFSIYL